MIDSVLGAATDSKGGCVDHVQTAVTDDMTGRLCTATIAKRKLLRLRLQASFCSVHYSRVMPDVTQHIGCHGRGRMSYQRRQSKCKCSNMAAMLTVYSQHAPSRPVRLGTAQP